jgi:tripartite-type tricarboxylate transporter receptor subunit TctC
LRYALHTTFRILAAAALVVAALALHPSAASAQAPQSWPQRTVKFILPLGPGSGVDIGARLFADRLSKRWGQSVVVENRPGADGVVAIAAFISARDDHTFLYAPTSSFTAHPLMHEKLPYDINELMPVVRVTNTIVVVAVPSAMKVKNVAEMFALAKTQDTPFNFTTATGVTDFIFESYVKSTGLKMTRIPYRDTVQALNDLGEGRIEAYAGAYAIVRPHAQSGRVKLLAVTASERAPMLPDLPTIAEAGYPALTFDGLTGLFGQQTLPAELKDKIAADFKAVATDAEIVAKLTATGSVVNPGSGADFAKSIAAQRGQAANAAKILGIKIAQ